MRAHLVTVADPFNPIHSRRQVELRRRRRLRALVPSTRAPTICLVNGRAVLRAGWNRRVRDGDVVVFVALPQGGGDGSNPLGIILSIAVSLIAPQIGALLYENMVGAAAITSMGSMIAQGIATFVGMALVNTLVPPPKPPAAIQAQALAAPSPTYSLGAQGNSARVGQPIPVIYGRHMTYPDWGAQPYTEFSGNEQFLYQMLVIGQGQYDIEQIRLEDTVIVSNVLDDGAIHNGDGSFEEVQYQVVTPGGSVTLFPTNVVTSSEVSGQELPGTMAGTYSQSGTTITVTKAAHGLAVGKSLYLDFTSGTAVDGDYTITGVPSADSFTVEGTSDTTSGDVTIHTYVGPFIINGAGTLANALAMDLVATRGLYYANTDGSLAQKSITVAIVGRTVDDGGAPTGAWTTLASRTLTAATTTPQRVSYRVDVGAGRYEVKLRRTDQKDTDARAGHDIAWTSGRAYLPGTQSYGDVTLLAIRMRASNQLSGLASRKINTISTRKLTVWNGTSWSAEEPTRSIAWALADICRASYGLGLPDSRIDLDGLLALDATWAARGDSFDGVFDSQGVAWEALQQVAKVGRAFPFQQGGVVTVARDGPISIPSAMLTTRNIVRGSFNLTYLMPSEETADAIDVTYFDSGVWQERTVRAALPGSSEILVAKVRLFGCTDRAQAWREGMYLAACNRYRRRHASLQTEMEGFISSPGDLIAIQHDMPKWGQSGEVVDLTAGVLTGTEPFDFSAGGTHYLALRQRDGSVDGPWPVTAGPAANQVVFDLGPGIVPDVGGDRERTHWAFGPADATYILARPIAIKPRSLERVEITAVVESDYVHTADTGTPPTESAWSLATRVTKPIVAGLMAMSNLDQPEKMFLSWEPAPTADHYLIDIRDAANTAPDAGWTRLAETRTANFTATAQFGNRTLLRVCAVGLTRGPWVEINYGSSASYMWSAIDTTLMWSATDTDPMWRY